MKSGVMIIAEAGVNHNGDLETAKRLIDVAAEAGADAVKFQTFKAALLSTLTAPLASYQEANLSVNLTQYDMLKSLELSNEHHFALRETATSLGIQFLSTPFDEESLDFLVTEVGMSTVKVPSGEITNHPYLIAVARLAERVILSTGASTLLEIRQAVRSLVSGFSGPRGDSREPEWNRPISEEERLILRSRLVIMHCVTAYPAPVEQSNLRTISTLSEEFGCRVGMSDHSLGHHVSVAALALGASVFEKHFTLDRALPGPDHAASLTPTELREYVRILRETERSLGDGVKRAQVSELGNRDVVRRSIVALKRIRVGDQFSALNVGTRRPAGGLSPSKWWSLIGTTAKRNYAIGDFIEADS
jgi:N-acetylneuraminate synthase